jgi:antirestriction protein ArdC
MPDERLWDHLAAVCEAFALTLEMTSESTNGARGWYRPSDRSVTVVDTYPLASRARTLLHELAHSLDPGCHDGRDNTTRAERELVAESVAYVVGKRLGLEMDACSSLYVASWGGKPDELAKIAHRVLELAERLEAAVTAAATRAAVAA